MRRSSGARRLAALASCVGLAVACGGSEPAPRLTGADAAAPPELDAGVVRASADAGSDRGGPTPPATCFDGISNGDETGVDCGGSCTRCPEGNSCRSSDDCSLGDCYRGVCALPPYVRRVTPSSARTTGGTALSIRGYFVRGVALTIAGKPTSVTFVSDAEIQVALPPALGAFGATSIRAIFPDGQSASNSRAFWYAATVVAFAPATTFATSGSPGATSVGDLDRDGRPDLVTTDAISGTLGVALGNGDGTFRARVDFDAGPFASTFALADVNGDGALDAVVANAGAATVSVLLGGGDGVMRGAVQYATGSPPVALAVVDLDADGKLDLAVACEGGSASILLGRGDGSFAPHADVTDGSGSSAIAVGDFNLDDTPDLAVAEPSANRVALFTGDGRGGFRATSSYAVAGARWIFVRDLNGDSVVDILTVSDDGTVSALIANRDGTFLPLPGTPTVRGITAVTLEDTNGDNQPDLVLATASSVAVFQNHGGGSFRSAISPPVSAALRGVAVADVNGDSKPDILATNPSGVTVVMNTSR